MDNAMSEYFHVEKPFLDQLATLGWTVIDQGHGLIPSDPTISLRENFREWLLPEVFRTSVRALNLTSDGRACQKEKGTGCFVSGLTRPTVS